MSRKPDVTTLDGYLGSDFELRHNSCFTSTSSYCSARATSLYTYIHVQPRDVYSTKDMELQLELVPRHFPQ